jgi:hypothetical protein
LCKSLFGGITPGLIQLGQATRRYGCRLPLGQFFRDTWAFFKDRLRMLPGAALIASGMATLYIGVILVSIFSALVVTDSIAISTHPGCALISYNASFGIIPIPNVTMGMKYYYNIETESGDYARKCYNGTDGADGCNYFYEQSIQFSIKENDTCPFESEFGDLCFNGPSSAFTLSTGWIRPETIGINTPLKYTFQRQTTCSPLRMDDDFIKPFRKEDKTLMFRYFYGHRSGIGQCSSGFSNCTFELPGVVIYGSTVGYTVL